MKHFSRILYSFKIFSYSCFLFCYSKWLLKKKSNCLCCSLPPVSLLPPLEPSKISGLLILQTAHWWWLLQWRVQKLILDILYYMNCQHLDIADHFLLLKHFLNWLPGHPILTVSLLFHWPSSVSIAGSYSTLWLTIGMPCTTSLSTVCTNSLGDLIQPHDPKMLFICWGLPNLYPSLKHFPWTSWTCISNIQYTQYFHVDV